MNQPFGQRAHRRLLTIRGGRISTTGIGFLVGVTPAAVHLARAAPSGVWLRAGCAILGGLLGAGVQGWGTTSACPTASPPAPRPPRPPWPPTPSTAAVPPSRPPTTTPTCS